MPGQNATPLLGTILGHDLRSSDWKPDMDGNLLRFDGLFFLSVLGTIGQNSPPGSPSEGDRYIVGGAPTGAWSGQAGKVALYAKIGSGGSLQWYFYTPREGWLAWGAAGNALYAYDGAAWGTLPGATGDAHAAIVTGNPHVVTQAQAAAAGGLSVETFSGAGPHTIAAGTDVAMVTTGSGNVVLNIPAASSRTGRPLLVKKRSTDSNLVTITPASGNVEGGATLIIGGIGRDQSHLVSDGTDYWSVGRNL